MKDLLNFHLNSSITWGADPYNLEDLKKLTLKKQPPSVSENPILLPHASDELLNFFNKRKSTKNFKTLDSLPLNNLSILLDYSLKIHEEYNRFTPAAGKIYSIECYLYIRNVGNLDSGIYYYDPMYHSLNFVKEENIQKFKNIFLDQIFLNHFSVAFILVLNLELLYVKYQRRSYRYGLLEAGHIAQNILVTAANLNRLSIPIGSFRDYELTNLLDLKYPSFPIYSIFIN